MFKQPFVSVIVVNYNGRDFIAECLESVLKSNYPNFEIIVVDNASADDSFQYLKKHFGKNKKINLVRSKKNLYFTGGSNLGARNAKGKKLAFLNSDTVVNPSWLKELIKFAKDRNKYLVQPKILFFDQKNIIDNVGGRYSFFGAGFGVGRGEKDRGQYDQNRQFDFVNGTCFMIDTTFFWHLGGFDERFHYFYEDVDLCLRAKRVGGKCWNCFQSVIYHRGSLSFKKNVSQLKVFLYIQRNKLLTLIKTADSLQRFRELKKIMGKKKFSWLDLGCGEASLIKLAEKKGVDVLGIDQKPSFHAKVIQANIEKFKLNQKFDVISLYHVLEHLKNPEKILKKTASLMKKKSLLVIELPLVGNFTAKLLKNNYFAFDDQTHNHFYTKKKLFDLIKNTGFEIQKKGNTLFEFPLTVLTRGGIKGVIFFLPLKILSILGFNDEIIRLYCVLKKEANKQPRRGDVLNNIVK